MAHPALAFRSVIKTMPDITPDKIEAQKGEEFEKYSDSNVYFTNSIKGNCIVELCRIVHDFGP